MDSASPTFDSFQLAPEVLHGVKDAGYTTPTPIQSQAIPVLLSGKDLIGTSQTGTGKTAAFVLPTLSRLQRHQPFTRCLILTPTRELCAQVGEAVQEYGKHTNLTDAIIYGGVGYQQQIDSLRSGADIVIATPGRLLDHMEKGNLKLNKVEILILDEADRMLDMGFIPDVRQILKQCPQKRQTMLFSATMPPAIENLCSFALHQPERIDIGNRRSPAETVDHALYPVAADQKLDLLKELLTRINYDQVIIFTRTKMGADRIFEMVRGQNHEVTVLHSDRTQSEREKALDGFRSGTYKILVATDIASRGIDVEAISHVVNYDVPENPEDYVHRIGRTGRAQSTGDACTIFVGEDLDRVVSIERYIGQKIPRRKLENFPYLYTRAFDATEPVRSSVVRIGSSYTTMTRRRKR